MGRCELRKAKQIKAPIDREIVEELTNRNIPTPRDPPWEGKNSLAKHAYICKRPSVEIVLRVYRRHPQKQVLPVLR